MSSKQTTTNIYKHGLCDIINQNIQLTATENFLDNVNLISDEYRFKGITKINPKNLEKLPTTTESIESIIKLGNSSIE